MQPNPAVLQPIFFAVFGGITLKQRLKTVPANLSLKKQAAATGLL
jgi:hypothetical protein